MTRLGNFSSETLAVDAISADISLLEKRAARGAVLTEDDLALLIRCHARLAELLPSLSVNNAPRRSSASAAGVQTTPDRSAAAKLAKFRESAA